MSDETSATGDRIPTAIGRYQITGTLGFGAMGAVYKAFDPLIKRTLAIKTIRLDVPRNSPQYRAFIERFYQEARISGTLSHPNIVTLFDIGEEGGLPFLAMEFIDGRTIASYIEEGVRFKPERVIGLVSQVAAGLDYAHSRGVVHRDIKPSNLMIHDGEKVKVTDFGIAKLADAEITHSGALLGTPSYMSPEQAMGERLDGRSDIFSLGVCAFEMLSGLQPFPGANVTSILYKLVHVDPIEPTDLEANGLVPQKWRQVFHQVLAKKPENRYQTASEFVRDLEYCLGTWFTGLGEATVSLAAPTPAPGTERTLTLSDPVLDPGPPPEPEPAAPPTILLSPAAPAGAPAVAGARDLSATVQLPPPATEALPVPLPPPEPSAAQTVLLRPSPATEESGPAATVLMAPSVTAQLPSDAATAELPSDAATAQQVAAPTEAVPAPRPGRPGLPLAWVAAVVAVLLVLAAGAVGLVLWRGRAPAAAGLSPAPAVAPAGVPQSPAAPPPSAAPLSGSLHLESDPPGAGVRVNGQARGQTPLDVAELPLGDYEVLFERRGYEAQTRRVSLSAAAPVAEVRARLARSAPTTGTAEIVSSPAGASVTVDGKPVGHTPLAAVALAAGSRSLRLTLDGHEPWSGSLDVVAGKRGRIEVRLKPVAAAGSKPAPTPAAEAVDTTRIYQESEVDAKPRKLSGISPSYPKDRAPRLRSGERVSVLLQFVVSETGEVQDVKVLESGGKAVDEVVITAVRSWRFAPATRNGTRVKSMTAFKQTFLGG
jgi:serine/threonine-protein kinase